MSSNVRPAAKAGPPRRGWYMQDPVQLVKGRDSKWEDEKLGGLDQFLSKVPTSINGSSLPIPGARIIISPHAGYEYSGPCAAWAYSCLDLTKAKRVFVLGPSHRYFLRGCAVSTFSAYATPLGNLTVDTETLQKVKAAGDMADIPTRYEKDEHSLEMQMPYLYRMCQKTFSNPQEYPKIIPMLVGDHTLEEGQEIGKLLLPYVQDPETSFIISSDFCHWGDENFDYSPYLPTGDINNIVRIRATDETPDGPPIHESIRILDEASMDAIKTGSHKAFVDNLKKTKNTVCGRYPIGVAMAALELYAKEVNDNTKARFNMIRYERSSEVEEPDDFSVSYVSAYAVL
ncbi:hypothetical protein S7711_07601 [Stachybotrys chartarum IBT 7711]|uniref:MEMO1 family protein n=1 Tax=Stachybotrys chartarum (strain CBS 109288 / IBT 7711) TaxID=1280523 RepID=A0A084BCG8_STACB|nr:hypothetical protein S7711_07601 [Stachybotrys chartarum IBT 7711]KFA54980.1 hypothetical protein S40293_02321 [Stachybotrys chartarum IBT 40293]